MGHGGPGVIGRGRWGQMGRKDVEMGDGVVVMYWWFYCFVV